VILQALNEHYYRLLDDPDSGIAPPGYSPAKVSHAFVLNKNGELIDIISISVPQGKKNIPRILLVPQQAKRTVGIIANYLCDNVSYLAGVEFDTERKEFVKSPKKFERFKKDNLELLKDAQGEYAESFKNYLINWDYEHALEHPVLSKHLEDLKAASNIVVKLDGAQGYLHENSEIRSAWENSYQKDEEPVLSQCLVTGKIENIERLHPSIKNVVGAQTSGASLVSFNAESFTSYNKSQSYNAPVSKKAAFAYGTALNYLLASKVNNIRIADATVVFWADKRGGKLEESILSWCLNPEVQKSDNEDDQRQIDYNTEHQARTILERAKKGLPLGDASLNPDTRLFLLGLAPNASRLSVRFWHMGSFGSIIKNIALHYSDMDIIGIERIGDFVSPRRTLKVLAVQEDSKNIPPLLGGQLLKSVLTGQMYPQSIYNSAIIRCRAGGEHNGVTTIRAAVIKAFLKRKYRILNMKEKEESITVGLNENNSSVAYQLGRLFSLLEKVQRDALGENINASIRDRYFGAASATPGAVFPLLLRLSRHHVSKSQYGELVDRKIQDVLNKLDAFPSHLNLEEQGQFILGYYHQNQANYSKNENIDKKEG